MSELAIIGDPEPWLKLGIAGAALFTVGAIVITMIKAFLRKDKIFTDTVHNLVKGQERERQAEREARTEDRKEVVRSNERLATALDGLEAAIRDTENKRH